MFLACRKLIWSILSGLGCKNKCGIMIENRKTHWEIITA